jgi:hypothetical protein
MQSWIFHACWGEKDEEEAKPVFKHFLYYVCIEQVYCT